MKLTGIEKLIVSMFVLLLVLIGLAIRGPSGTVGQRRAKAERNAVVEMLKLYPEGNFRLTCQDPRFENSYYCTVTHRDLTPFTIWCRVYDSTETSCHIHQIGIGD